MPGMGGGTEGGRNKAGRRKIVDMEQEKQGDAWTRDTGLLADEPLLRGNLPSQNRCQALRGKGPQGGAKGGRLTPQHQSSFSRFRQAGMAEAMLIIGGIRDSPEDCERAGPGRGEVKRAKPCLSYFLIGIALRSTAGAW